MQELLPRLALCVSLALAAAAAPQGSATSPPAPGPAPTPRNARGSGAPSPAAVEQVHSEVELARAADRAWHRSQRFVEAIVVGRVVPAPELTDTTALGAAPHRRDGVWVEVERSLVGGLGTGGLLWVSAMDRGLWTRLRAELAREPERLVLPLWLSRPCEHVVGVPADGPPPGTAMLTGDWLGAIEGSTVELLVWHPLWKDERRMRRIQDRDGAYHRPPSLGSLGPFAVEAFLGALERSIGSTLPSVHLSVRTNGFPPPEALLAAGLAPRLPARDEQTLRVVADAESPALLAAHPALVDHLTLGDGSVVDAPALLLRIRDADRSVTLTAYAGADVPTHLGPSVASALTDDLARLGGLGRRYARTLGLDPEAAEPRAADVEQLVRSALFAGGELLLLRTSLSPEALRARTALRGYDEEPVLRAGEPLEFRVERRLLANGDGAAAETGDVVRIEADALRRPPPANAPLLVGLRPVVQPGSDPVDRDADSRAAQPAPQWVAPGVRRDAPNARFVAAVEARLDQVLPAVVLELAGGGGPGGPRRVLVRRSSAGAALIDEPSAWEAEIHHPGAVDALEHLATAGGLAGHEAGPGPESSMIRVQLTTRDRLATATFAPWTDPATRWPEEVVDALREALSQLEGTGHPLADWLADRR